MADPGNGPSMFLAQRYSSDAELYDEVWSPVIRPAGEALVAAMKLGDASRIVDAGAGAGALAEAMRSAAPRATVLGLDLSPGMLEIATTRRGVLGVLGDAMRLPVATSTVDAVVLAYVLFHLPVPEAALSEAVRVLRPNGVVGLITWMSEGTIAAGGLLDAALDDIGAPAAPWSGEHQGLDSHEAVRARLHKTGLTPTAMWTEAIEHQYTIEGYWRLRVSGGNSAWRLRQLDDADRSAVLARVRREFERLTPAALHYCGEVIVTVAELA